MRLRSPVYLSSLALAAAGIDHVSSANTCPPKDITALLAGTAHTTCPLPTLLTDSHPGPGSPWTHTPFCTNTSTTTTTPQTPYCIYTSTPFGPHGLSLISKPPSASSLTPILSQIHHSSFPSPSSARNLNLSPATSLVSLPGKGKGLVATRRIPAGETFLIDHAALVIAAEFFEDQGVSKGERVVVMNEAVDRLLEPGVVRGLDGTRGWGDVVEDVVHTNTFRSNLGTGEAYVLFPLISRVNHACKPSAFIRYASHGLIAGIAAFRDIELGEEITISYIPLQQPSPTRRSLLRKNWNFTCTCPLCTSPQKSLASNDALRMNLQNLEQEAIIAIGARDLPSAMDKLTALAMGFEAEGLWPLLPDIYQVLATVCWAMGGREEVAVGYLERKVDVKDRYGRLEVGDWGVELAEEVRALEAGVA